MSIRPLRILVVYYHPTSEADMRSTIRDHLRVLEFSDTPHELTYFNAYEDAPFWDARDEVRLDPPESIRNKPFDVILIHYTFLSGCIIGPAFFRWKRLYEWIGRHDALRIALPQDEGNCAEILEEWLMDLGVEVVFSVHYRADGALYPSLRHGARIERCLPGYIDDERAREIAPALLPIAEREMDIVYRARRLPHWFGRSGLQKYQVAHVVRERAAALGLRTDISTRAEDVIVGSRWLDFIASGRAVIGVQGGYSAIDWRGGTRTRIQRWLSDEPGLTFDDVHQRMPAGWDDGDLLTVTPRHLEAVVAKTAQILIKGDYRDVLRPDEHYLPLRSDFSNTDAVLERLRDHSGLQEMVDRAYEDIYCSGRYSYTTFARDIERVIDEELNGRSGNGTTMNTREAATTSTRAPESALERALVAERHRNELLELKLMELSERVAGAADAMPPQVAQSLSHANESLLAELRNMLRRAMRWLGLGIGLAVAMAAAALIGVIVLLLRGG